TLTSGEVYSYRVKYSGTLGDSGYSNTASASIQTDGEFFNYSPPQGTWVNQVRPTLAFDASDTVDLSRIEIEIADTTDPGHIQTSPAAVVGISGHHVTAALGADLAEGLFQATVHSGAASGTWQFGVDLTAPIIGGLQPASKTLSRNPDVEFTVS